MAGRCSSKEATTRRVPSLGDLGYPEFRMRESPPRHGRTAVGTFDGGGFVRSTAAVAARRSAKSLVYLKIL